jgi:aminoglycoside/choline kinase family phosphotransferase
MTRDAEIGEFLAREGWGWAERTPLAGDASARRYERLRRPGAFGRAILMDVPPASGIDVRPFLAVTAWLRAGRFSAPEVLGADQRRGLVLIEDLGDDLFAALCAAHPGREPGLYRAAVDALADLQLRPAPGADVGWTPPPYDMAFLLREARLVPEWYLPAATGRPVSADLADEFEALTAAAFAPTAEAPPVPVLRDYHAENLIWLPDRRGHGKVGMLDYQDMLLGHPAYDLVSLVEDARRDTSEALRAAMLARYLERSGADPEAFTAAAHVLAAQRNLKILGLFTRLCRRDGKPRYLGYLPRVWGYLTRDLAHPALAPLAGFVARHVPPPETEVRARIVATA